MARTLDYFVKFLMKEDGVERDVHEASLSGASVTRFLHQIVQLTSKTTNWQVSFGSNFTTPTKLFLQETGGRTFTYSLSTNARHHAVAANGFAAIHANSITKLYLSNNGTSTTKPTIEIVAVK